MRRLFLSMLILLLACASRVIETDGDADGEASTNDGCGDDGNCEAPTCTDGPCPDPRCSNELQDGAETDLDCGGPDCPACSTGESCLVASDCSTALCLGGVCNPACDNGVRDGDERDVDCGGTACPPCG